MIPDRVFLEEDFLSLLRAGVRGSSADSREVARAGQLPLVRVLQNKAH